MCHVECWYVKFEKDMLITQFLSPIHCGNKIHFFNIIVVIWMNKQRLQFSYTLVLTRGNMHGLRGNSP
jgi:hypothetical protein